MNGTVKDRWNYTEEKEVFMSAYQRHKGLSVILYSGGWNAWLETQFYTVRHEELIHGLKFKGSVWNKL